jgi:hypothetical protein
MVTITPSASQGICKGHKSLLVKDVYSSSPLLLNGVDARMS